MQETLSVEGVRHIFTEAIQARQYTYGKSKGLSYYLPLRKELVKVLHWEKGDVVTFGIIDVKKAKED